jgi:hypothetical protein
MPATSYAIATVLIATLQSGAFTQEFPNPTACETVRQEFAARMDDPFGANPVISADCFALATGERLMGEAERNARRAWEDLDEALGQMSERELDRIIHDFKGADGTPFGDFHPWGFLGITPGERHLGDPFFNERQRGPAFDMEKLRRGAEKMRAPFLRVLPGTPSFAYDFDMEKLNSELDGIDQGMLVTPPGESTTAPEYKDRTDMRATDSIDLKIR